MHCAQFKVLETFEKQLSGDIFNYKILRLLLLFFRRYADEHLLTEIQDPRSDDELDLSGERSYLFSLICLFVCVCVFSFLPSFRPSFLHGQNLYRVVQFSKLV